MAETYHVYDVTAIPIPLFATFAAGLPDSSRVKMHARGEKHSTEVLLSALIADNLATIAWMIACTTQKHPPERPGSVLDALCGSGEAKTGAVSFASGEDFMRQREAILRRHENGD